MILPDLRHDTDFSHRIVLQFGLTIALTLGGSALLNRVGHIVFLGAEEKMVGSDARWIVTCVQNIKTKRDGAEVQFP